MAVAKKPKSVMITIRDRKSVKSKSFTVYGSDVDEVFKELKKFYKIKK